MHIRTIISQAQMTMPLNQIFLDHLKEYGADPVALSLKDLEKMLIEEVENSLIPAAPIEGSWTREKCFKIVSEIIRDFVHFQVLLGNLPTRISPLDSATLISHSQM